MPTSTRTVKNYYGEKLIKNRVHYRWLVSCWLATEERTGVMCCDASPGLTGLLSVAREHNKTGEPTLISHLKTLQFLHVPKNFQLILKNKDSLQVISFFKSLVF